MIAALYVETGGCYYGLPDVDPWNDTRDARTYAGPHPPCSRWCQLAHVNQARYGHKVGDDGGCFKSALAAVRKWGGVLEHPAWSYAWRWFDLPSPEHGQWLPHLWDPGWVTQVSQVAYGHRARKRTWLYYVGDSQPPALDWSEPDPTAQVSFCKNHGDSDLPRLSKKEAKASPPAFRDLLLSIARTAKPIEETA